MSIELLALLKLTLGSIATLGLYSVLYKENKVYRFFEHLFLGLAAGYAVVALWQETLYVLLWKKMWGTAAEGANAEVPGYWAYVTLIPIGLMGYMVFSKKHSWMSRIPIGIILGLWSGQQILNWWRTYSPQIYSTMQPIFPTTWDSIRKPALSAFVDGRTVPIDPARAAEINANVYPTQALSNLVFVITLVAAVSYFIFSFELKGKFLTGLNTLGRWCLMVGFGAIFGSTVMARFALVIDRMSYIFFEWINAILRFGG